MIAAAGPWLAAVLVFVAIAAAIAVVNARSLFVMSLSIAATSAVAAATVLALRGGDGALALAAFGVGLAPIILLAGVLLSARVTKAPARGVALLSAIGVAGAVAVVLYIAQDLPNARPQAIESGDAPSLWLGALLFVVAIGCAGLLGYGERGVLDGPRREL
ncbi:hypothetical protein [Terricaulis silvestris]|uniref:Putative monovalent cation/H+ antiporter subunit B n=1 Tax=Terricaulis silvestris TaxID=2686094 RepID=A0A6I6MLQ6_9CAUL|nr:hypothetical protein [Terricaulis silvestris]QGZ95609.1 putative monovalent cation/H+ antiporter subunit B [Terricaulis silvestris]